ncbi:hypothetical protein BJX64DRAFT_273008 [Aspergillus heterothallicus]
MAPRAITPAKVDPKRLTLAAPVNSGASGLVLGGVSGDVPVGTSVSGGVEVVVVRVGTGGAGVVSSGGGDSVSGGGVSVSSGGG